MTYPIEIVSITEIVKQLHDDATTILTPNRRLAATLHRHHQLYQAEQSQPYWRTPDILPLTSWLERLYNAYADQSFQPFPLLLNNLQESFLWEKIIASTEESEQLLQISETADMVRSAFNLLKQWQVDLHDALFKVSDDYSALQKWILAFQTYCEQHHCIDTASLFAILAEKMDANFLPKQLILMGFTELSPALTHLLACCEKSGSKIRIMEAAQTSASIQRSALLDQETEIITIAKWAKEILAKQPKASIGCVIPSLEKNRERVHQLFSEIFAQLPYLTVSDDYHPFNISAGKSLLRFPIVHTAIQLLSLHKKNVATTEFNYLLASPFVGEAESERIERANLDRLLRQANVKNIDLLTSLQKTGGQLDVSLLNQCPLFAKRLQAFFNLLETKQENRPFCEWTVFFNQLLTELGWPGERSLNSEEYQVVESWLNCLAEFSTLDHVSSPVNFSYALKMLIKMLTHTVFQPKTPEAPIQVLGILEAAALPFDYLWVSGLDDLSWPPQPKPNPFIPKRLQRELRMPHATAERELIYCEKLIQQFKRSARHVIFSHAEKNEELELQASPLIRDFDEIKPDELKLASYSLANERIYQSQKIERLENDNAPPLLQETKIRGGVNVIKQQALCPFKAFAEWRLHAHPLESPLPGLRAKDRGSLIHKALEAIWNKLQTQSALLALDDISLTALIETCIEDALQSVSHSRNEYRTYLSLEKKRLQKLLQDWLAIEKSRPPFTVIMRETSATITLNQLTLSFRVDRVDELPDGKKIIIDYKTGKNNEINSWFGERPEEPQLPLYSLLDTENTAGITFAQVVPGEVGFKGVSHYSTDIPGIKLIPEIKKATAPSWPEQLTEWQTTLNKLSQDFCLGISSVDPKEPNQTCMWCELKPLCRINEEQ